MKQTHEWLIYPTTLVLITGFILGSHVWVTAAHAEDANDPGGAFPADFNPFAEDVTEDDGPAPMLQFNKLEHDFGIIAPRSKHECTFRFTNTGPGLLKIKKTVRSTCGCAVPKLEKTDYASGEKGQIKVTYIARSIPGTYTKHLYVQSNDPNQPITTLSVKVNVVSPVKHTPEQLTLPLNDAKVTCPPITFKSTNEQAFSITGIMATGDVLTGAFDPNQQAQTHLLQPVVNREKLQMHPKGFMVVSLNHPDLKQVRIAFRALSDIEMTPSALVIFKAEPNVPIEREVLVVHNYNKPFAIKEIQSPNRMVQCASPDDLARIQKPATRHSIPLKIIPPERDASQTRFVSETVTLHLSNDRKLTLRMRLVYAPAK